MPISGGGSIRLGDDENIVHFFLLHSGVGQGTNKKKMNVVMGCENPKTLSQKKKKTFCLWCTVHISLTKEILYPTKTNQEFLVMTKFQQSTPVIAIFGVLYHNI